MAEYYKTSYGNKKNKRSVGRRVVDVALLVLSVGVGLFLLLVCAAPYLPTSLGWPFAFAGLAFPLVFLLAVVMLLVDVVLWHRLSAVFMLLSLLVASLYLPRYYKFEYLQHYDNQTIPKSAISVLTYNVRQFYGDKGCSTVDSVAEYINSLNPDIICLQEFNTLDRFKDEFTSKLQREYSSVCYSMSEYHGSAIISRYKIVDSGKLDCPDVAGHPCTMSVWADLVVKRDTIRVFSNHLQSTKIKKVDSDYIMGYDYLSDTTNMHVMSIFRRFRDNMVFRAAQVDTVARHIAATPYPKIVCGDFNDTPISYAYRKMSSGLNDAFSEVGRGYSHTYNGFYETFRIDFVLYSDQFEALSYAVDELGYSDHYPVYVKMNLIKK